MLSQAIQNISSVEAMERMQNDKNFVLVDVRTPMEWSSVGIPDLQSLHKDLVQLSWREYPAMQVNPLFMEELQRKVPNKESTVYFICKAGGRSFEAAATAQHYGYTHCINIHDGFEGETNDGQRGSRSNGWKASGLPWKH